MQKKIEKKKLKKKIEKKNLKKKIEIKFWTKKLKTKNVKKVGEKKLHGHPSGGF